MPRRPLTPAQKRLRQLAREAGRTAASLVRLALSGYRNAFDAEYYTAHGDDYRAAADRAANAAALTPLPSLPNSHAAGSASAIA